MLGHRGCRLGITFPEITSMQSTAIFEATVSLIKRGYKPLPEIMIPLVGTKNEFIHQKNIIETVAKNIQSKYNCKFKYLIGTMIELPRACITADEIGEEADFFSFGTNDLTQTTFGYSRDDIGSFLSDYITNNILTEDPFQSLDVSGVGELVKIGVEKGRINNKSLKIGICGEHGGDPKSIKFFNSINLDYVSCSPFRIPIAILAAAKSEL
jgi:pyruvate,orthophosphate dikinase